MVLAIMTRSDDFFSDFFVITPRALCAAPLVDLDIDTPRTLDVFNRLQKAQPIGQVRAEGMVMRGHGIPELTYMPIKAPGTPIIIPDWFQSCGVAQMVADHRFATSQRADDEMWSLLYERRLIWAGHPSRMAPLGPHIDDNMSTYLENAPPSVVSTLYLAYNAVPTICYDRLRGAFNAQAFQQTAEAAEQAWREADLGAEEDNRRAYYKELVHPEDGKTFPAGTVVVANGATLHEVSCASETVLRGFTQIRMADHLFSEREIKKLNPPLWQAMQSRKKALAL